MRFALIAVDVHMPRTQVMNVIISSYQSYMYASEEYIDIQKSIFIPLKITTVTAGRTLAKFKQNPKQ